MELRKRDSHVVKRVTSTSPPMKNHGVVQPGPISACSQNESIRSQIKRFGPICRARKKTGSVSPRLSMEEHVDFDKQLGNGSFLSAADDSMWLSSGSASSSAFFKEHELLSPFLLVADEWLVSWLSTLADSYVSLGNSCKSKPEEHKSMLQEGLESEEGVAWPLHSSGNYATDPPADSSEGIMSSSGHCSDESTSDSNYSMSPSTNLESSSQVLDMDNTSLMASSLNLDENGSQWMSNTESELDYFHSCFPSPSCKRIWGSWAKSGISNREDELAESNLPLEQTSEAENMEDFSADEPLFWPFDRKIDWNSEETWKYFSMSPRKDIINVTTPERTSPKSIASELSNMNRNLPTRCRKKSVSNSGSTASKILELKQVSKGYNKNNSGRVKRGNVRPSRLRESTKDTAKIVPLDIDNQILPLKVGEVPTTESILTSRNVWDDDFPSNEELPIETVLGLGEFDGHEGIDLEFNEGIFLLDEAQ